MTWTLCTSGQAIAKAGTHANSTLILYAGNNKTILDAWSDESEGQIEAETGMSIKSNFAGYALSGAASAACSSLIASNIIAYDPTGYLSREADTLLNLNDTTYKNAIKNMIKNKTTLTTP